MIFHVSFYEPIFDFILLVTIRMVAWKNDFKKSRFVPTRRHVGFRKD